jgi:hypothetical protein
MNKKITKKKEWMKILGKMESREARRAAEKRQGNLL